MDKIDYLKHFKQFQKIGGKLREFCDTRRPRLKYEATKKAFHRIKTSDKTGTKNHKNIPPKSHQNVPLKMVTKGKVKHELVNLAKLPKGLSLSPKEQAVADNYLVCMVQVEAYLMAYPDSKYDTAKQAAARILERPDVITYLEYHRSLARAKVQIDLKWINERRKQIAGTDLRDVADFGEDNFTLKDSTKLSEGNSAAIKKVIYKKKYINVPGPDGDVQEIIELQGGIELDDRQKALNDLEKSLISPNTDSSTQSSSGLVQQWWGEFLNPIEGEPKLSALGFSMRLDSINHKIPKMIEAQAKAELAVLGERALGGDKDDVDVQDRIHMRMQKLKDA